MCRHFREIKFKIFLTLHSYVDSEALHVAHLMASHGYFFPIDDHCLTVKNDNTFYRFQTPYFWPSNCWEPENTDYGKKKKIINIPSVISFRSRLLFFFAFPSLLVCTLVFTLITSFCYLHFDTAAGARHLKCYSCLFMQKDDAEQNATGIGGLRGGEPS